MSDFIEKELTRKLYEILVQHPGIQSTKLAEMLRITVPEVEMHLRALQRQGILVVSRQKGYAQYYVDERGVSAREKRTLEIRRRIYALLVDSPGLHLSRIAELLHMSIPLTDYHLLSMERKGELTSAKDGRGYYKRYYVHENPPANHETQVLELLQKKTPLQIIMMLFQHPVVQHKEFIQHVDVASSTLSYYLIKLTECGIVAVQSQGTDKGYTLKDRKELIRILKKYEFHIELQLVMERFKNIWDDLRYQE